MTDVFLDHKHVGTVTEPAAYVKKLIQARRDGKIPVHCNMYYDASVDTVLIETSRGRPSRPLIIVKEGKPLLTEEHMKLIEKGDMTWTDIVRQGIIEYLDSTEEESAYVAFEQKDITSEHTHLEINPLDIFGLVTSLVPFGHHNQAVRLAQGSKNQKQALGFYAANYFCRMDMDVNLLHYPQFPIVNSITHFLSNYDKHPSGMNVTVAVLTYQGYNMEDAIVINKGSIERGLGRSTFFMPVITEELRYSGGLMDQVTIPDKDVKGYKSEHDYRFLEDDGIIYPEAAVGEGDVIIGKSSPPRFLSSMDEYNLTSAVRRESSLSLKHGEHGVVDFVLLTENEEGNKLIQARLREQRIPEIGDKFTSRHGQKGVISLVVPESDMPFSVSGIKPDILFNPHGVPTRMSVSHLIELIGGKVGALAGRFIDGTIFASETEEAMREELTRLGFRENGTEMMYDGRTGMAFPTKIYIGNMYYMKLRHMVANKIHSRARGPIQLLTRQPTEGRAKEGGLRLGEMEKDTLVAHGASLLLKERFDSDRTLVPICVTCGSIAVYDARRQRSFCSYCGEGSETHNVEMSYAFKLILDEFKSMTIFPKLELRGKY
ncbi:MAG: DNA-directed RNA polymerase subunit B [Candidatus Woesearchaeota archaeon]